MNAFPSFDQFFKACTDYHPYAWQRRLTQQLLADGWPSVIDIPTGLGKTSVLLSGIYAVAHQVHHARRRTLPQRLMHIVDRRIIVEQTHQTLELATRRINAGHGDLAPVRDALRQLGGPWNQPLVVDRIHGESPDQKTWLRPTGCTVVTMTTHQAVSRMLFRGFGCSEHTRSIHAGLLGVDAALILDEPHLSYQAVDTLKQALNMQPADVLGIPASSLVLLGASTPPDLRTRESLFELDETDLDDANLAQRLRASKPVRLMYSSMKDTDVRNKVKSAVKLIRREHPRARLGIIVNTIALAQDIVQSIYELDPDAQLITSRMRPIDRRLATLQAQTIVATQALEVGVDISFDFLITEEAPWPSLVQRLGRFERNLETDPGHEAIIITGKPGTSIRRGTAAVYDESPVATTRTFLHDLQVADRLDFSLAQQLDLRSQIPKDAWPLSPRLASFHRGFLQTMATTYPTPRSDIPVGAFISGPERQQALDVLVCWRDQPELARLSKPRPDEQVSVPVDALRTWLTESTHAELSDLDGVGNLRDTSGRTRREAHRFHQGTLERITNVSDVVPGDAIVINAREGGYLPSLGWFPDSTTRVSDVSLASVLNESDRFETAPVSEATLEGVKQHVPGFESLVPTIIMERLFQLIETGHDGAEVVEIIREFGLDIPSVLIDGSTIFAEATDELRKSQTKRNSLAISLSAHQIQVEKIIQQAGLSTGLSEKLVRETAVAGRWHDQGKTAHPFQLYLGNVNPAEPWAKSLRRTQNWMRERMHAAAVGHDLKWRHEGYSAILCSNAGLSELVIHLVRSHHGRSRPLLLGTSGPSQCDDDQHVARFWRLNAHVGPWGLAYLEALVRLSDWLGSSDPRPDTPDDGAELFEQATSPHDPERTDIAEKTLEGIIPSPMTGWYAVVGLLFIAHQNGVNARIRWDNDETHLGEPKWSSSVPIDLLAEWIRDSNAWDALGSVDKKFAKPRGLSVKFQKVQPARVVADILRAEERSGDWALLGALQDWAALDGHENLSLTLPAFNNNSSYIGQARKEVAKDSWTKDFVEAIFDPVAGWSAGGCDGGMDRGDFDTSVTGWEAEQSRRTIRGVLAPAALYGMLSLGSAGAFGVGPDGRGTTAELPMPSSAVTWPELAALTRAAHKVQEWKWVSQAVNPSQGIKVWQGTATKGT